jgi:hypothetical protein
MHSRLKLLSLATLATLAVHEPTRTLATSPEPKSQAPAASAPQKKPASVLEKGMTEAQIIAAIGRPAEIKPMKFPEGSEHKAETWVYRRSTGTRQVQVATGTRSVPTFGGMGTGNDSTGSTQEIIYTTKHITTYSVTWLLMIDGKLELARQTTEQEERF